MPTRRRLFIVTTAAAALALMATALGHRLAFEPRSGPRAFETLLVDLAELGAFGACAWSCLATTAAVLAAVRGAGSLPARVAARITPRVWAQLIGIVVGGAVGFTPVAASAADDASGPPRVVGLRLPDRPTASTSPAPATTGSGNADVIVRRGDSLWRIAAAHLPAGADDASIARSCGRWYAANRAVIGPDRDLLLPGTRLATPTDDRERNR